MRFRSISISAQTFAAAMLLGALMGCESADEEQSVLSAVNNGVSLLEKGDPVNALRLTSKDFVVQPGRLNRKTVLSRLNNFYRVQGDIEILHPNPEVEILDSGKAALVSAPFVAAKRGVSRESLDALVENADAWEALAAQYTTVEHAEISLVKENDRWLVSSVRF